jgi:hypothetical protein
MIFYYKPELLLVKYNDSINPIEEVYPYLVIESKIKRANL